MPEAVLQQGERLDDLLIHNLKIIQHPDEFCFSLDAILLAHFASLRPHARVVDLGTGSGVIGLVLTARGAGLVTGVEINETVADMAERSVRYNQLTDRMHIVRGDIRLITELLPAGEAELVVANPPYWRAGGGLLNPREAVARARHELSASLNDVVQAARHVMKYRGRFALVHLPERMTEVLGTMNAAGIEPKRLRLVYPRIDRKPNLLLVEGVRGAKPGMEVLPPLIVYQSDGDYCEEILSYYGK